MIKKITSLLIALLCCNATALAVDYTGTMSTTSSGGGSLNENNSVVTLEQNDLGICNVTIRNFKLVLMGEVTDLGTLEYTNMMGIPGADGYKTIKGTKYFNLIDVMPDVQGLTDMFGEYGDLLGPSIGSSIPLTMEAKFNDTDMTATFQTQVTISVMGFWTLLDETVTKQFTGTAPYIPEPEPDPVLGDLNNDDIVDVSDVNIAINIILAGSTDEELKAKADLTGDGSVDVSDVNAIINIILK